MSARESAAPTAFERWELPNVGPEVAPGQRVPTAPLTAAQVESVQSQAYNEASRDGYQQGYQQGLVEGAAEGRRATDDIRGRLEAVMQSLADPLAVVDAELEKVLLNLTLTITQQLVRRELKTDPGQVLAGIRDAVAVLGRVDREVKLYLHHEDIALINESGALGQADANWQLVEDPTVSPGGCRVQSGSSYIDATIEHRMASVVAQVLGGARKDDSGPTA